MKVFTLYFFFAIVALAIQATLFKGAKPDFVLILVCFFSLKHGQIKGMAYGALTGLLIDVASSIILGTNMLSKAIIGYFIASVRGKVFQWGIIINTVAIIIFSIIDIVLIYVFLETFTDMSFAKMTLKIPIMQVVYTTIFSLLLYPALNPEKDKNWELRTGK